MITCASERYPTRHRCCGRSKLAPGCQTSPRHVHEQNLGDDSYYENGWRCTQAAAKSDGDDNRTIYAFDCEMLFTKNGYEAAQVTLVDHNKKVW